METMTKEIAIIQPTQLEEVVTKSGLEIQEGEEIKKSYLPFLAQLADTQAQAEKINFENPSQIDETIARELRLKTVKIRTGAEKLKEDRKKTYLLRGNLEQAAYNLIAASCKLTEETFFNVEKAREIAERKRQQELRREREEKLSPYTENVVIYPLGIMSEDEFNSLYIALRTAHEDKIEAEKKAEAERIAKEKAEAEERERIRQENERLKKEAEELERKAKAEAEKQAKVLAEEREKAEAERKALEEKARKEREERERLEAEIKAKEEAEKRAREEEAKKKAAMERKAKLAPDKDKLLILVDTIKAIQLPEVKNLEVQAVVADVKVLLNKVTNFIIQKSESL